MNISPEADRRCRRAGSRSGKQRVYVDYATRTWWRLIGPVEEQTLAWLPATSANVAKLSFTPPAGFRRVAPPPFRGDGRPGLGQIP